MSKISNLDEYGNALPKSKTYTQEEADEYVNRAVRDRLARFERNNPDLSPHQQQQVKQATEQGFEYDANSAQDWQAQLKSFIKQTHQEAYQEQIQQASHAKEMRAQADFDEKFGNGMKRFSDFADVVQPYGHLINEHMVKASRDMSNPAAFFYAACQRMPKEIERIASYEDNPYKQVKEIAKLEEKLKQTKSDTKTPRPLSRTQDDSTIPHRERPKEKSIEEKIADDQARRLSLQKKRRG